MRAADIARQFQEFFAARQHTVVPSASLLYNDPTLLFVNAGMVPFKPYFTGAEPAPFRRAVSVQKCVRTLDIDEVGKTTRHGTFFQMLGNFSFGDYFKREAIQWAYELVTTEPHNGGFGFDPASIWVTVLGPGHHPDYPNGDAEAADLWRRVGVPDSHIQRRSLKDNYWNMGVPGPGGPCSEIYIDRGPAYGSDGGPEVDEDRFLEIWNLVFQTEDLSTVRAKDDFDIARKLPSRNIDTGAGLERIAYLLQGVDNMYEIDEVFPVIQRASELSGRRYGADHDDDVRLRVVADHVRSALMLMTDGVTPSNESRGYVLRRLIRRAIRSMRLLGVDSRVLVELLDVSRRQMHASYPEVDTQWARISDIAEAEEISFRRTLNSGTALFEQAVAQTRATGSKVLPGDKAFQLHDTYGFPIDLTLEMAAEQGLRVDQNEFRRLMAEQRNRAKADAKAKKGAATATEAYRKLRDTGETPFLGYTDLSVPTKVRGLIVDGQLVSHVDSGQVAEVVLAETPFYAEAGGQDADAGVLRTTSGELNVLDVQRPVSGLIVHKVQVDGGIAVGDQIVAEVDADHRRGACQAHSATHLLHAALRELVGPTATQAGSYNKPGYLRFDFSSAGGLSEALRAEIEERVNTAIRDDLDVSASQMPLADARALGAMAMFGEKYPPIVRVIEMGGAWSRELCGGTHVEHTSQIGLFTLVGEQSIGAGTRRVEGLVSTDAFARFAGERALVDQLTDLLKVQPDRLPDKVSSMVAELKAAQKQIDQLRTAQLLTRVRDLVTHPTDVSGVGFAGTVLPNTDADRLRRLASELRDDFGERPGVVALLSDTPRPSVVVATTAAARRQGVRAGDLVRAAAERLGGRGGGHDDLAQGGGGDATAVHDALRAVEQAIQGALRR